MGSNGDRKDPPEVMNTPSPMPPELQGHIGKKLREAYTELISEPVPDRFVALLQQLKKKEAQGEGGDRDS